MRNMGKLILLPLAVLFCSCAPRPDVMTKVENRAKLSFDAGTKFCLVGDPNADPQVRERVKALTRDGLAAKGFSVVACADAQYAVLFDWRVSEARESAVSRSARQADGHLSGFMPSDYSYSTAALVLALYDARKPGKAEDDAEWYCGAIAPVQETGGFAEWGTLVSSCLGKMGK